MDDKRFLANLKSKESLQVREDNTSIKSFSRRSFNCCIDDVPPASWHKTRRKKVWISVCYYYTTQRLKSWNWLIRYQYATIQLSPDIHITFVDAFHDLYTLIKWRLKLRDSKEAKALQWLEAICIYTMCGNPRTEGIMSAYFSIPGIVCEVPINT